LYVSSSGYYVYDNGGNFIISDKNPLECSKIPSHDPNNYYSTFKTKGPNKDYVSISNNSDDDGVCLKRFYMQKGPDGEDATKKLCDKLPSCKGYYKNLDESVYVIAYKDPGEEDADSGCDEETDGDENILTYPSFYKKQNTTNT